MERIGNSKENLAIKGMTKEIRLAEEYKRKLKEIIKDDPIKK